MTKKNTENLTEVNGGKTKYMLLSHHQNSGQNLTANML
jgi:hypothetical protein